MMQQATAPNSSLLVSPSQIGTFNRCSYKWHLSYQEGWSNKNQPIYFRRGGLIHEALAAYYEAVRDGLVELGDTKPVQVILNKWIEENVPLELMNECSRIVMRYIRDFSPFEDKGIEILEVEKRFVSHMTSPGGNPYTLQGIVDLVIKVNDKIFIVDHKSSGNSAFRTDDALAMDSQLPIYEYLLRREGLDVFGLVFNFLNTYAYRDYRNTEVSKLFKRMSTYRTDHELKVIVRDFGRSVDDMYEKRNRPYRNFAYDCDRCDMQELCLMDMRGIDLERNTPVNFVRNPNKMIAPNLDYGDDQ